MLRIASLMISGWGQLIAFGVAIGGIVTATPASAQLSPERIGSLLSASESATRSLDTRDPSTAKPFPSAKVEASKTLEAIDGVANHFAPRTSGENFANWMNFLQTERLAKAIRDGADRKVIEEAARRVRGRLIGRHTGLELPALARLRDQTEELLGALRFEDEKGSVALVRQEAEALQKRLRDLDPIPAPQDAAAISAIVHLLEHSDQFPSLVSQFRSAFSQPNLVVTVDGQVIEQAVARAVDQNRPVRDCILGTTVVGTGRLQGNVTGKLLPSRGSVQLQVVMNGFFNSNTVGHNRGVRLPTVSRGQVNAQRSVWIDERGVRLSPTSASAAVDSTITSIQHPLRIVRRIARNRAAQQQPQAEAIASERLRSQISREFDNQTSQVATSRGQLANLDNRLAQGRMMLKRFHLSEPTRQIGSNSNSVFLEATLREATQLAACNPPPAPDSLRSTPLFTTSVAPTIHYDQYGNQISVVSHVAASPRPLATLQLHESLVDNVATRILAGRTLTGKEIDQLLAQAGRPMPAKVNKPTSADSTASGDRDNNKDDDENFEIDFSNFRPVVFELRDQKVRVGIRGTRFKQGERELKRPVEITTEYTPARMDNGQMLLVRSDKVDVEFPGTRRTVQQIALRRAIEKSFSGRFPETLLDRPIAVPSTVQAENLRGRVFQPALIDARDGWMSIGLR
jgi:hypothetical protein